MVEDAIPRDNSGNLFRTLTAEKCIIMMSVRVAMSHRPGDKAWESLHSLLVTLFKDRRAKLVRHCKTAFQHAVSLAEIVAAADRRPAKKTKTGGFPVPPTSKRSSKHSTLGVASASMFKPGPEGYRVTSYRVVQRGLPIVDEDANVTGSSSVDAQWVVGLAKLTKEEFFDRFAKYKPRPDDNDVLLWDFPDHPLFLPYYAAVCHEFDARSPVEPDACMLYVSRDGTKSAFQSVANVVLNNNGAVVEVSGPSAKFEAFVASQVGITYNYHH